MMPVPGGALVSARIVARTLGLNILTIRRWIRKGRLDGLKISGRWYVKRDSLDRLLATRAIVE